VYVVAQVDPVCLTVFRNVRKVGRSLRISDHLPTLGNFVVLI